jgi:Ca-activated chloride channel family protein
MTFLAPSRLLLLLAVGALAGMYVVLQRRRRHYAVKFTNLDLLQSVAPRRPGWRRHVAAAAVGLGLVALVIGLARPVRAEKVPRDEAIVMLVVDVSASMAATDVSPSRLQAATTAATEFVNGVPAGFEVGLVAFDKSTRLLATPTADHAAVIAAIQQLKIGPGTATGDALSVALDAVAASLAASNAPTSTTTTAAPTDQPPSATIVLLSDGATTVGQPITTAEQIATDRGIPVTTIAYGTNSGTVVVNGQSVAVPADPASMSQLAKSTGGSFFTAGSAAELSSVYHDIQSRIGYRLEDREILRTFLGIGIVALLVATAASLLWNARFL